jgi:hypothetical protein
LGLAGETEGEEAVVARTGVGLGELTSEEDFPEEGAPRARPGVELGELTSEEDFPEEEAPRGEEGPETSRGDRVKIVPLDLRGVPGITLSCRKRANEKSVNSMRGSGRGWRNVGERGEEKGGERERRE